MAYFIKLWSLGPKRMPFEAYLVECDLEANEGAANFLMTNDPKRAMAFESPEKALEYYRRRPICRPNRYDGGENRPMTAFSIEIVGFDLDFEGESEPQRVLQ